MKNYDNILYYKLRECGFSLKIPYCEGLTLLPVTLCADRPPVGEEVKLMTHVL